MRSSFQIASYDDRRSFFREALESEAIPEEAEHEKQARSGEWGKRDPPASFLDSGEMARY